MMNNISSPTETLRFIHISDTHFGPDRSYTRHGYESYGCARKLVEMINGLPAPPDFVMHTGDVTTNPEDDAYVLAAETLAGLEMPVFYVVGNHDRAADIRRHLSMGRCEFLDDEEQLLTYRFDLKGYRMLVLDARAPDEMDPHGLVSERQMEIVRAETETAGPPLAIFVHYPLHPLNTPWMDSHLLILNGAELHEALLPARDRLRGVFFGHVHMPSLTYRDGILYSSAASSFANFIEWPEVSGIAASDEPPGFNYVYLMPEQTVVRHHVFNRPSASPRD